MASPRDCLAGSDSRPSLTRVRRSEMSHPSRADTGRVLETAASVVASFPLTLILTVVIGYETVSPCTQLIVILPCRISSSWTRSPLTRVLVAPVSTNMSLQGVPFTTPWQ